MPGPTRYNPVTKVVTMEIPFLSLVTRADPDWARVKYWDIEYEFTGKNYYANPYRRGVYDTPTKTVNISYPSGTTFAAGDITGEGFDFVYTLSQAVTPGTLITRTAAQMFNDIPDAEPGLQWMLRMINFGGTSDMTLLPGVGVTFQGILPIKAQCYADIVCTLTDANDATFVIATNNNPVASTNPLTP